MPVVRARGARGGERVGVDAGRGRQRRRVVVRVAEVGGQQVRDGPAAAVPCDENARVSGVDAQIARVGAHCFLDLFLGRFEPAVVGIVGAGAQEVEVAEPLCAVRAADAHEQKRDGLPVAVRSDGLAGQRVRGHVARSHQQ